MPRENIMIEASYTKTLGLPGYSSHSYTMTMRKTLRNEAEFEEEGIRMHGRLQSLVDDRMRLVGYLPDPEVRGMQPVKDSKPWQASGWVTTEGHRTLLNNLIAQYKLDQRDVRNLAMEMFGAELKWPLDEQNAWKLIEALVRRNAAPAEAEIILEEATVADDEFDQQ